MIKDLIKKYQKVPVVEYSNEVSQKPLVTVMVLTYNHENYITQCLESIVSQITDFDIEILVGEDESQDSTREICKSFAERYPNKIRLFLQSRENNIMVYGKPTARFNFLYLLSKSRGKYIAICEGDDYWIDSLKLQKQYDFLEEHPDYGMVFSDVIQIDKKGNEIETEFYKKIQQRYKSGKIFWDLLEGNFINTLTVLYRKELILDYLYKFDEEFAYDLRMWLHFSTLSKIKYFPERFAAYRVHDQGMSRQGDFFIKRRSLVLQSALIYYFNQRDSFILDDNKKIYNKTLYLILANKNLSLKEKKITIKRIFTHPVDLFRLIRWAGGKYIKKPGKSL